MSTDHTTAASSALAEPSTGRRAPSVVVVLLVVVAVAVAAAFVWVLVDDASAGVEVGVCALLAAAPVGYALAAWLPLRLAVRRGAAYGLRVTEPGLWAVATVTTIVLDKTGTVTTGDLKVVSVDPVEPDHDRNLRWFAAALEHAADDPVARAISTLAGRGHLTHVVNEPGAGISGYVDRHPVRVGRPAWIGYDHPGGAGTTVAVEVDARVLGHITVDDVVRDDAAASVDRLRALDLAPVLVSDATGPDTERVARAVGIDVAHAEVTPDDRASVVTALKETGEVVAVLGARSTNDDALAVADLAITDSPAGGPPWLTLDTLDAGVVAGAVSLGRATLSVVRANRVIGLVTPVVGLAAAAAGLLSPMVALTVGVVGVLLVVGNSLRLRAARA